MSKTITVPIEGMSCSHCVKTLEKGLGALPEVESVKVDLNRGSATLQLNETMGEGFQKKLKETVSELGYEVGLVGEQTDARGGDCC